MPPDDSPLKETQLPETITEEESLLGEEAKRSWKKENRQIILLGLGVAVFMMIAHFTPLRAWITNIQVWKEYIRELGWLAHGGFALLCATSVMVGIPRLSLCAAAGLLFGFGEGLALSFVGSVLGSYGAFILARKGGRRAVRERASRWPWLEPILRRPSWFRVFWVRQLMLPGIVLNVLFGVSDVRHRTFLAGTSLGYLPLNIAFCLVGSGLGKDSLAKTLVQLLGAIAVVNIISWASWRLRAMKNAQ
jgi:uncharacterized membrane protein YdjX (TVP38/TMEM64 family)